MADVWDSSLYDDRHSFVWKKGADLVEMLAPEPGERILDLGCGTGLLAVAVADLLAGPIIGVDLSGGMLIEAARRTLYAELHRLDIEDFLARETRQFGLVMAGDVLPYFGDLGPVFRAVAGRLLPMGCFMLSLEALPAELDRAQTRVSSVARRECAAWP